MLKNKITQLKYKIYFIVSRICGLLPKYNEVNCVAMLMIKWISSLYSARSCGIQTKPLAIISLAICNPMIWLVCHNCE